jgi:DNA-binding NarL/FixJ family response regulator
VLGDAGFEVCAQCTTAEELLFEVERSPPDVAIVDIRMPPTHTDEGVRAALAIRARHPSVGVLVLSQYVELGLAMELLSDSVEGLGYLLKDRVGDLREFADAVRRVAEGGSAVDAAIVTQLLRHQRGLDPLDTITPREREVLSLMAEGRSNQGIADRLEVTERAVQKHITAILRKLGLEEGHDDHRRVLAVLAFLRTNREG